MDRTREKGGKSKHQSTRCVWETLPGHCTQLSSRSPLSGRPQPCGSQERFRARRVHTGRLHLGGSKPVLRVIGPQVCPCPRPALPCGEDLLPQSCTTRQDLVSKKSATKEDSETPVGNSQISRSEGVSGRSPFPPPRLTCRPQSLGGPMLATALLQSPEWPS